MKNTARNCIHRMCNICVHCSSEPKRQEANEGGKREKEKAHQTISSLHIFFEQQRIACTFVVVCGLFNLLIIHKMCAVCYYTRHKAALTLSCAQHTIHNTTDFEQKWQNERQLCVHLCCASVTNMCLCCDWWEERLTKEEEHHLEWENNLATQSKCM